MLAVSQKHFMFVYFPTLKQTMAIHTADFLCTTLSKKLIVTFVYKMKQAENYDRCTIR